MDNGLEFVEYMMPDGNGRVRAVVRDETIWVTQRGMSELFGVGIPAVNKHIKNIYEEGELNRDTTISKMEIVVNRGIRGEVLEMIDFYNLDVIISVGYRVNSSKATRFRQWATKVLNEYIRKGFAIDDGRLKHGITLFGKDYFRELLERIRSIRASERRIWQPTYSIARNTSIRTSISE